MSFDPQWPAGAPRSAREYIATWATGIAAGAVAVAAIYGIGHLIGAW